MDVQQKRGRAIEVLSVIGIALGVVVLGSLPWLLAERAQPPGTTFLGTNIPDVLDAQVYYAFIQENADGNDLYRNLFTPEEQPAVLFHPLWWILGRVVATTGASAVTVFWVAKAILGALVVVELYWILRKFIQQRCWRVLGLVLAVFGSGLGGLFLTALQQRPGLVWVYQQPETVSVLPVDSTYPAGFIWSAVLHSPLYIMALGLLLWVGWMVWRSFERPKLIHAAGAGVLLLGLIHPYDLFLVFTAGVASIIIGIIGNIADQTEVKAIFRRMAWLAVWALPATVYYGALTTLVPALRGWNEQNILETTNLRTVVAGFAPLGLLAVFGIRQWWTIRRRHAWFLLSWISAALALMYVPGFRYQAKMVIGLSVPLAIFAVSGLQVLFQKNVPNWFWRRAAALVLIGTALATPGIFVARVLAAEKAEGQYFFLSPDLHEALEWMKTATPPDSLILGDVYTGNLVPYYARRATYLGHHHQTSNFRARLKTVRDWFFEDNDEAQAKTTWLKNEGVDYVVFSPHEQRQGTFQPELVPSLEQVFERGNVRVFRVVSQLGD